MVGFAGLRDRYFACFLRRVSTQLMEADRVYFECEQILQRAAAEEEAFFERILNFQEKLASAIIAGFREEKVKELDSFEKRVDSLGKNSRDPSDVLAHKLTMQFLFSYNR
jgi:hypothetical protein